MGLLAVYLAFVSTYQILHTTLFPEPGATEYSCRRGVVALYESVETARALAAAKAQSERDALSEFRTSLTPVWSQSAAITQKCELTKDSEALRAVRAVELLRYAEERAVRYSSLDLTQLRKRAPQLLASLGSSQPKN